MIRGKYVVDNIIGTNVLLQQTVSSNTGGTDYINCCIRAVVKVLSSTCGFLLKSEYPQWKRSADQCF